MAQPTVRLPRTHGDASANQPQPEETTALLTRLSQKPGVTSTLILSRSTGAIVRASGLLSSSAPRDASSTPASAPSSVSATTQPPLPSATGANGTDGAAGQARPSTSEGATPKATESMSTPGVAAANNSGASNAQSGGTSATAGGGLKSAEDVARIVWTFFGQAGETATALMGDEDEVRLVRLRTRRNEIVVVPDARFLLVCVHDTPPA